MFACMTASEMARQIRNKAVSPVEVVDDLLDRIGRHNHRLNAYLTVSDTEARQAAMDAELTLKRSSEVPPLLGVPFSIKDVHFTQGTRTTGGSLVFRDFVPREDCVVVERLRQAGAILTGKTNTPELALSSTTENLLGDDCRNPWDTSRTSGGSSGGAAAAQAAGLSPISIGSDRGGSIRIPAAFCGVYALKPTHGRIPITNAFAGPTFTHIGPLTRSVYDAAFLLEIMAGFDGRDPTSMRERPIRYTQVLDLGVKGLRVAWSPQLGNSIAGSEARLAAHSMAGILQESGCIVEEAGPDIGDLSWVFPVLMADQFVWSGHLLEEHADRLTPEVKGFLELAATIPAHVYARSLRSLEGFRMQMAGFFEEYDLLLSPSVPYEAFPLRQRPAAIDGQEIDPVRATSSFTFPFNLTGGPAANVPCGFSANGLPLGLQVGAAPGRDDLVLRASAVLEEALPWQAWLPSAFAG